MPLDDAYDKMIKSDIADMKNVSDGRGGGSITAAMFLQRFVNDAKWAHLDIAGITWTKKDSAVVPKGATAFGVRLLDRLVADALREEVTTRVGFYHLTRSPLEQALPRLLDRARGGRPHGAGDGRLGRARRASGLRCSGPPIRQVAAPWHRQGRRRGARSRSISPTGDENPNGADMLVLLDGVDPAAPRKLRPLRPGFDGNDGEVGGQRPRTLGREGQGPELAYHQQTEDGGWEEKATANGE